MFEAAEIGNAIDKKTYAAEAPKIREALLRAQIELARANLSVVILISGVEGAGKSETVNLLLEWMDARGIQVHAMSEPTDEEMERPMAWRFWRLLPPRGRMGIFFGSWYTRPIVDRVFGRLSEAEYDRALDRIVEFERMVADEDTLVLKFWMHLSKARQKKRLRDLESDPKTAWRVTRLDWKHFKRYDDFVGTSERALRRTSTAHAPWHIVEAQDDRYRSLTVTRTLLKALEDRIAAAKRKTAEPKPKPDMAKPAKINIINQLDLGLSLPDKKYDKDLVGLQAEINRLTRRMYEKRRSMIVLFEGPDAAGKGGAIRRLTSCIDARQYQVISVAAPTDEEKAQPYLWRFWRHLPRLGRITIYDRSWYGRVLVERVEGFCRTEEWRRAYTEINSFETQLTDFGIVVLKFWLAISPEEQLRRFKDRETTPYKQYKITEEDWRNRAKWNAYEAAACDMIEKTGNRAAPWILVEANDKNFARIKVMRAVAQALKRALKA